MLQGMDMRGNCPLLYSSHPLKHLPIDLSYDWTELPVMALKHYNLELEVFFTSFADEAFKTPQYTIAACSTSLPISNE